MTSRILIRHFENFKIPNLLQSLFDYNKHKIYKFNHIWIFSSADYLRELNVALGRQEISSMNLVFFNLYYRQKHGNNVLHPAATCEETQMGIIEKIKGLNRKFLTPQNLNKISI